MQFSLDGRTNRQTHTPGTNTLDGCTLLQSSLAPGCFLCSSSTLIIIVDQQCMIFVPSELYGDNPGV